MPDPGAGGRERGGVPSSSAGGRGPGRAAGTPLVELAELHAGYGETRVLHGLSLAVPRGQVTALLGRNGAGKTTTLRVLMGLVRVTSGTVALDGRPTAGTPPHLVARLGVAYVPETRDIFPSLTVAENLHLASRRFPGPWTVERVLALFPRLAERLGNGGAELSGGEQQMLAIARALLMNPRLLLLDEPTEGLAPIIIRQIRDTLAELRGSGLTLLLVEQNFGFATSLADRVAVLGRGRIVWEGTPAAIRADMATQARWLGI